MHVAREASVPCMNTSDARESPYSNIKVGTTLNYIAASEIPLPNFCDSSDQNTVLPLRQTIIFNIKAAPKSLQLAIAIRTMKSFVRNSWIFFATADDVIMIFSKPLSFVNF
jgi:hypothetical protein